MLLPEKTIGSFRSVAFDPQSRWLIASGNGTLPEEASRPRPTQYVEIVAWNLADGKVAWQILEKASDVASSLVVRPGSDEFSTCGTKEMSIWSSGGKQPRKYKLDFLCCEIAYSPDGALFVAPDGKQLNLRNVDTGEQVVAIELHNADYRSAEGAAFLASGSQLIVVSSVINSKGHISGIVQLVDVTAKKVLKSANIEMDPDAVAVDPQGRWACIIGEKKKRGAVLFWDLQKWKARAEQGAHGNVSSVVMSPDGEQVATTGYDHVIRIWDCHTGKTITKLEPGTEDNSCASVAWSADGNYLAFAAIDKPPAGGVFLYRLTNGQWEPLVAAEERELTAQAEVAKADDLRHVEILVESTMDTVGSCNTLANQWPILCQHCTFPDINAVPQPYLLVRGHAAAGDFATAAVGNFLVREPAKRMFEVALPGACQFYPTTDAKTKKPTDWFLAVPQTMVLQRKLKEKLRSCQVCGRPKMPDYLEPELEIKTAADVFKNEEWTCWETGEEVPWYAKQHFKTPQPKHQWTRLCIRRRLQFSTRLLFLLKELQLKGLNWSHWLKNSKPTAADSDWIAEKLQLLRSAPASPKPAAKSTGDATKWLKTYLKAKAAEKPMTTAEAVAAWEQKNKLKLPKAYVDFVTTIGRHKFNEVLDREGYSVRIVGPKDLDAKEYRRDLPEEGEQAEPDGVLFAVAINGDALCFDLRGGAKGDFPVFHFDHETESFEPFADNFAAAVKRMEEKN